MKRRLWEVLKEKEIWNEYDLRRAIRSIQNDKRLSLEERIREKNMVNLQFINNGWRLLNELMYYERL